MDIRKYFWVLCARFIKNDKLFYLSIIKACDVEIAEDLEVFE
jgi:hypothetical protein